METLIKFAGNQSGTTSRSRSLLFLRIIHLYLDKGGRLLCSLPPSHSHLRAACSSIFLAPVVHRVNVNGVTRHVGNARGCFYPYLPTYLLRTYPAHTYLYTYVGSLVSRIRRCKRIKQRFSRRPLNFPWAARGALWVLKGGGNCGSFLSRISFPCSLLSLFSPFMLLPAQRVTGRDSRESCWKAFGKKTEGFCDAPSAYLTHFWKKEQRREKREKEREYVWINEWIVSQYNSFRQWTKVLLSFVSRWWFFHDEARLLCESCSASAIKTPRSFLTFVSQKSSITHRGWWIFIEKIITRWISLYAAIETFHLSSN